MLKANDTHCNIEHMLCIREHIVNNPRSFDMDTYERNDDECGTVGCIAGWACMFDQRDSYGFGILRMTHYAHAGSYRRVATDYLGIADNTANELFYVKDYNYEAAKTGLDMPRPVFQRPMCQVTPAMAVQAIDNVIATGRPNWRGIFEGAENAG